MSERRGFCYFVPGATALGAVRAAKIPAFADAGVAVEVRGSPGPPGEKQRGQLAWLQANGVLWRIDKAAQVWHKIAPQASGAAVMYWVGYEKSAKPGPADLKRETTYAGADVSFGGLAWKVPLMRLFPRTFALNDEGEYVYRMTGAFKDLYEDGMRYLDIKCGRTDNGEVDDEWLFSLAARVLALNYRIGMAELAALELLNVKECLAVLDAAVDWALLVELGKKNEGDGAEADAGPSKPGSGA